MPYYVDIVPSSCDEVKLLNLGKTTPPLEVTYQILARVNNFSKITRNGALSVVEMQFTRFIIHISGDRKQCTSTSSAYYFLLLNVRFAIM